MADHSTPFVLTVSVWTDTDIQSGGIPSQVEVYEDIMDDPEHALDTIARYVGASFEDVKAATFKAWNGKPRGVILEEWRPGRDKPDTVQTEYAWMLGTLDDDQLFQS